MSMNTYLIKYYDAFIFFILLQCLDFFYLKLYFWFHYALYHNVIIQFCVIVTSYVFVIPYITVLFDHRSNYACKINKSVMQKFYNAIKLYQNNVHSCDLRVDHFDSLKDSPVVAHIILCSYSPLLKGHFLLRMTYVISEVTANIIIIITNKKIKKILLNEITQSLSIVFSLAYCSYSKYLDYVYYMFLYCHERSYYSHIPL
jgi:hypothetical protein